jgi:hypothetical protein
MGNLTIATTFIVLVNVLMWFSALAMLDVNPTGSICFHAEGSIIGNSISSVGNYSTVNNDALGDLPNAEGTVTTASNPFTDIFNNILSWFKTAPGLKYIYGVVSAPYNVLSCTGLPNEFIVGIGTLWYMVSLLVLLAFLWGRD